MEIPGIVTEALDAHREVEKRQAAVAATIAKWRVDAQEHVSGGRYAKAATLHAQADALQTHVQITFDNEKEAVARTALVQALGVLESTALAKIPAATDVPWRDGGTLFRMRQINNHFMPQLTGHEKFADENLDAVNVAILSYKARRDQWAQFGGADLQAWVATVDVFAAELQSIAARADDLWCAIRKALENPYPAGAPSRWALETAGWVWRPDLGNGGRWTRPGRPHADDANPEAEPTALRA